MSEYTLESGDKVELRQPSLKDRIKNNDMLDYDFTMEDEVPVVTNIKNSWEVMFAWCGSVLPEDFDLNTLSDTDVVGVSEKAKSVATLGK